ncbi:PREDICTED: F-box protein At1g78280-like [Branchiostoma belcheri]|uniref:F-box protein At1g78280-like n=1 Tax=Branchiostoma belcheri TaxID=7741 RepID=A0A6P5A5I6_BRABE|nr:PREDICTED: F-box protein At1g78280-like [Branchiostoma belcheri]
MEDSAEDSSPVLVHRRRHLRFPNRRIDKTEDTKGPSHNDSSVLDHPWFRSFDHLCLQLRQVCLIFLTAVLPLSLSVISMIWYNGGGGGAAGTAEYKLPQAVASEVDPVEGELYATENYAALHQQADVVSRENLDSLLVVDRRHNLSYEDFIAEYDGKRPVILTDVVPDWAASTWSRDFFLENYANDSAVVKTVDGNGSISSAATTLADFAAKSSRGEPGRWMYLEDELFIPTRPELRADLGEVEVLGEDFFQLFPKEVQPWDALLLWGSPSSRSPLHIDPYNWTGINAVISGRKKWKLFPPGQDQRFYITPDQRCGFPLDCIKYNSPVDTFSPNNTRQYPDFQEADFAEVVQVAGELLVIPTGWFHQAYNMEETIAVSRQVMNTNSYREVMEEIIKAGNIDRVSLPPNFPQLSPRLQVQTLVDLLPGEILEKGRLLTDAVLGQINGLL